MATGETYAFFLEGDPNTTALQPPVRASDRVAVVRDGETYFTSALSPSGIPTGFVGDGIADDGPAFNALFDVVRDTAVSDKDYYGYYVIDMGGGVYRVDNSIDATGISSGFNVVFKNATILGHCSGSIVLDLTASRGLHLEDIFIWGDETDTPSVGIQQCRQVSKGAAGQQLFSHVMTDGFFTTAGLINYASEVNCYNRCSFWNRQNGSDTWAAVFQGTDSIPVSSDYIATATGPQSFLLNKLINCEFRRPPRKQSVITGISVAADGVVALTAGHEFVNGDTVWFNHRVNGMTEIRVTQGVLANQSGNAFTTGINTSGFTPYTSGGTLYLETGPSIFAGRAKEISFDGCYAVAYNSYSAVLSGTEADDEETDSVSLRLSEFDIHHEGVMQYCYNFLAGVSTPLFRALSFKDENVFGYDGMFTTDAVGPVNVDLARVRVKFITTLGGASGFRTGMFAPQDRFTLRKQAHISVSQEVALPVMTSGWATPFVGETIAENRVPPRICYEERLAATGIVSGVTRLDAIQGILTTQALTTAAGGQVTIVVLNDYCVSNDGIILARMGGTNTDGTPCYRCSAPTGEIRIIIDNKHATEAFNGTFQFCFELKKLTV